MSDVYLDPATLRVGRLLAEGLDESEIAAQEGVTLRTIRRRVAQLQRGLGASTRFQAGYLYCIRTLRQ